MNYRASKRSTTRATNDIHFTSCLNCLVGVQINHPEINKHTSLIKLNTIYYFLNYYYYYTQPIATPHESSATAILFTSP